MTGLKEILERGLPEAPALDGLAGRVETGARRRRVRRRAGLAIGAVVVVVASVGVTGAVSRPDPDLTVTPPTSPPPVPTSAPASAPPAGPPVACRSAVETRTVPVDGLASVRLCRTGGPTPLAPGLVAGEPVTTDLQALVSELNRLAEIDPVVNCVGGPSPRDQEIQVGYGDGTARSLPSRLVCGASFRAVVSALGAQAAAGLPPLGPKEVTCPTLVVKDSFPPALESLTRLPAVAGVLCRYPEGSSGFQEALATTLDAGEAEEWRAAILGAHYDPAVTRCAAPLSSMVKVHLRVADGDVHELVVGPCGDTWLDRTRLGLVDTDTLPIRP